MQLALQSIVGLHLEYDDQTFFGSVVSGQLEASLKQGFRPLVDLLQRDPENAVRRGPALLGPLSATGPNGFLRAPGVLRDDLLWPSPEQCRPAALRIDRPGLPPTTVGVPASITGDLAAWLGEWQWGTRPPASAGALELWNSLIDLGCFGPPSPAHPLPGAVTFLGHATVLLSGRRTNVLVDPFLLADEASFPAAYRPISYDRLRPCTVVVTHSHLDHFHVDSLLRLGRDTPIFVPEVERESALAVDMTYRLGELGFTDVHTLRWHETVTVGDFTVTALPFYGEQPTTEAVLHPEVRNMGNSYLIEGDGRRYAFIADSGRDRLGDVRQMATEAFERSGPIDVLFGGFRSWSLYPIQYATSSVPQFLLFTPPALWTTRQQIMNDQHALLDTAERWHARYVVPYANGGAPWYWNLGLGPRHDRDGSTEDDHFDPFPESVVQAAAGRSDGGGGALPSPVVTRLVRPGESLDFDSDGDLVVLQNDGHVWPYAANELTASVTASDSEPMGLTRKRVLLRMLAKAEFTRLGLTVTTDDVVEMSDDLRRQNGLLDHEHMLDWLRGAGLSMPEYCEIVAEWHGVIALESLMADEIEKQVTGQRAFASMRDARR